MQAGPLCPDPAPWFADAAPGLLTNRTIRSYLEGYSQQQWPAVVKLTMLHGIQSLQRQHPGVRLALPQLRRLAERGAAGAAVEAAMPGLQRQLLGLQQQLDRVYDDLASAEDVRPRKVDVREPAAGAAAAPPPPPPPPVAPPPASPSDTRPREPRAGGGGRWGLPSEPPEARAAPGPAACSSGVHGDRAAAAPAAPPRHRSPAGRARSPQRHAPQADNPHAPAHAIYPAWWGDPKPPPAAPPPASPPPRHPRAQPRLSYSVPPLPAQAPAHVDDLATARYLRVASSGYGDNGPPPAGVHAREAAPSAAPAPCSAAAAPGARLEGEVRRARRALPRERAFASLAGAAPALPPRPRRPRAPAGAGEPRRRRLLHVQSRIKPLVAASRSAAAAAAADARRQVHILPPPLALAAAAAAPAAGGGGGAAAGGEEVAGEELGVAAVAQRFLSQPWACFFLRPPLPVGPGGEAGRAPHPALEEGWQARAGGCADADGGGGAATAAAAAAAGGDADAVCWGGRGQRRAVLGDVTSALNVSTLHAPPTAAPRGGGAAVEKAPAPAPAEDPSPLEGLAGAGGRQAAAAAPTRRRQPWAADFGHLDSPRVALAEALAPKGAPPHVPASPPPFLPPLAPAAASPRPPQRAAAGDAPQQLHDGRGGEALVDGSKQWVGDFGHLQKDRPLEAAGRADEDQEGEGAAGGGRRGALAGLRLFLDSQELGELVAAAAAVDAAGAAGGARDEYQLGAGEREWFVNGAW